ncbi:MAG: biotin--[acetyl-CoA-carboxylase] ligase [Elusimicrobiota bacterium]
MNLPGISSALKLPQIDSTQSLARALAESGAPDGTLVWADLQTQGRGRMERAWESQKGGLYISLILRPAFAPSRLAIMSLGAAKAAAGALARLASIETYVKPPNDVYARAKNGNPSGKISGVLAEAAGNSERVEWVVLGVGINVNNAPRVSTAASLKSLTGKSWSIPLVLREFLSDLQKMMKNIS